MATETSIRISSMWILIYWGCLTALITSSPVSALGFQGPSIFVISDLHLKYGDENDPNAKTYGQALKYLEKQPGITDIIINGDIFDAPTISSIEPETRIKLIVDFLTDLKTKTNAKVHFNFGNHDLKVSVVNGEFIEDQNFTFRLKKAILNADIHVIGTDFKAVYDYPIGRLHFQISHSPFVMTQETLRQSERFRKNPRAYRKVTNLPEIKSGDGIIRVSGDSHTPLIDVERGVYNAGKLAFTPDLQSEPNTILRFDQNGQGILLTVNAETGVSAAKPQSCIEALTKR